MDSKVFSQEAFAFAQFNEAAVADLLNRPRPNGGGNDFYNIEQGDRPATRVWARIAGGEVSGDSSASSPHFHADGGGFDAGVDFAPDASSRIGVAAGYGNDTLSDGGGDHANETLARVSLYGSENLAGIGLDGFGVAAALSYAHSWDRTDRQTGVGGASAKFDADEVTGAIQLSRPFDLGGLVATPDAGLQVSHLHTGSFQETFASAPAFAVSGASASTTFVQPYVEFGLSKQYLLASGAELTPDIQVGYRYDGGAEGQSVTLQAADGTTFQGNRVGYDRSAALVRLGVVLHQGAWTGFLRYHADLSGNWSNQTGQVGVRFVF